ncbi:hypothetical protein HELRODRAFT_190438 [Helobdella robusta]|uniref:Ig-like domain-containing protein n=1 Tax=Helobdella robusta TaxID=6412 RepID=T1FRZ8_HELRO|nr:hypothetical protein HELRODRAFT_190438 [Helobdella robusta]ESO09242.1 hypothetical protein HELRODRAFT_190438 [Helobdella robusta]
MHEMRSSAVDNLNISLDAVSPVLFSVFNHQMFMSNDLVYNHYANLTNTHNNPIANNQNVLSSKITPRISASSAAAAAKSPTTLSSSSSSSSTHIKNIQPITLVENIPSTVVCTASGGYPLPDITVQIAKEDRTNEFLFHHIVALIGSKSMRKVQITSYRWKEGFVVGRQDAGKLLTCVATVPGLKPLVLSVVIRVHYPPILTCDTTFASLGDRNVHLRCIVHSNPPPFTTQWIIDNNNTKVSSGDVINQHWTLMTSMFSQLHVENDMDRFHVELVTSNSSLNDIEPNETTEIKLHIVEVRQENFRTYEIMVTNEVGTRHHHVTLVQKVVTSNKETMDGDRLKTRFLLKDQAHADSHNNHTYHNHNNLQTSHSDHVLTRTKNIRTSPFSKDYKSSIEIMSTSFWYQMIFAGLRHLIIKFSVERT